MLGVVDVVVVERRGSAALPSAPAGFWLFENCVGVGLVVVCDEGPLGTAESRRRYLWGHARPAGRWIGMEPPLAVGQLVVPGEQAGVDFVGRQMNRIAVAEVDEVAARAVPEEVVPLDDAVVEAHAGVAPPDHAAVEAGRAQAGVCACVYRRVDVYRRVCMCMCVCVYM